MNCHFPHKAGVADSDKATPVPVQGKYLLSYTEEQSCFNTNLDRWGTSGSAAVCHGSGAAGLNAVRRNIRSLVDETSGKPYKHGVGDSTMSGRHQATEGRDQGTGLAKYNWTNSGSLWHVECDDCHNSHTARSTNHVKGANGVNSSSPLYGSGGARATAYPGWAPGAMGTYAYIEPIGVLRTSGTDFGVSYEYEICFKCHTDFAWGSVPPVSPSFSPAANMTNQAVEFNPGNFPPLSETPSQTIINTSTNTATVKPTQTPTLTTIISGPSNFPKDVNPLTGLKMSNPENLDRLPVAVKVANFPRSFRPQSGLSFADLVFEYTIGWGENRFLALYYGQDATKVGPMRSARLVDARLIPMYHGVLAYTGADTGVISRLLSVLGGKFFIDGPNSAPAIWREGWDNNAGVNFVYTNASRRCLENPGTA